MNALTRIAQQLFGTKLNQFQMRREGLPFVRRKRSKQVVAMQVGLKGQHDFSLVTSRGALHFYLLARASGEAS
jgi:hypothetical protein